jgi:hypothetical protein
VINDVKSRKIILDVDDDVVLQDPSGMFNDQGTTALQNESYLDPVVYEFMKQEQWDKLIQSWEAQSLKPGAFMDYEGVVDLSDFMVQRYLTKIQIANERLYWLGKASTFEASFTAAFPGLLPSIASASGVYKVNLGKPATSMAASAIDATGGNYHCRYRFKQGYYQQFIGCCHPGPVLFHPDRKRHQFQIGAQLQRRKYPQSSHI